MPKVLAVEVVQDVRQPERTTIVAPVGHEIHGPDLIRRLWYRQRLGLFPLQPLAGYNPQVQRQFAVNPVDPLVVSATCRYIKSPGLLRFRQPKQQVGNLLGLPVQPGAIPMARLTDIDCPARQRDTDALHRHRFHGQLSVLSWPDHQWDGPPRA